MSPLLSEPRSKEGKKLRSVDCFMPDIQYDY
jgi:hypothetical protein